MDQTAIFQPFVATMLLTMVVWLYMYGRRLPFIFASGLEPKFNTVDYNYLVGDILEARNFDSSEIKLRYAITAPRGQISIEASATQ